jgi:D-proline reductase (dithiol) PrdB
VGLAAREIERVGIATVSLSIVREITEKTPPPRALFMRWPFGHALGEVGKREQQLHVLAKAFELIFEAEAPGELRDSGLRWRREKYSEPDWELFAALGPKR